MTVDEAQRPRRNDNKAMLVEDLPEEAVEALDKAEVPAEYDYLNAELED